MLARFDIFKAEADGDVLWLASAESMDAAKAQIQDLGATKPGSYVILSQITGNQLSVEVDSSGELRS